MSITLPYRARSRNDTAPACSHPDDDDGGPLLVETCRRVSSTNCCSRFWLAHVVEKVIPLSTSSSFSAAAVICVLGVPRARTLIVTGRSFPSSVVPSDLVSAGNNNELCGFDGGDCEWPSSRLHSGAYGLTLLVTAEPYIALAIDIFFIYPRLSLSYYYFFCHPTIPDESNQIFIRYDDTVLFPGRMHPEHKPTVAFVIKNPFYYRKRPHLANLACQHSFRSVVAE